MSVFEMTANEARTEGEARPDLPPPYETSPFAAARLFGEASLTTAAGPLPGEQTITTPFSEALASFDEADLEAEAFEALRAEFEDEEFNEALEALADEAAARHLTAAGSWSPESESVSLASSEAEQWMETVAAQADRLLSELEAHFGERPIDAVTEAEIEAVMGYSPINQQEQFFKALVNKVKKVAKGVGKLVKKGIRAVGKLFPLGKLFGILKRLVRPLLERVLKKAIGKLPPALQPIATRLAGKFGKAATAAVSSAAAAVAPAAPHAPPADAPAAPDAAASAAAPADGQSAEALADGFDSMLAEAILARNDAAVTELLAEYEAELRSADLVVDGPYPALDTARQKLARQLVEAQPGRPPTAEMEEFIPVVLAAMPLIKLGVQVVGRQRVVGFLAKLLATLIQGMVGQQAAGQLSRHVADAGLGLLGLEAERSSDGMLGAEALVATAEDTIREVLAMPAESLEQELLLEAAVQEAFTAAAIRHFPAEVLRADLTESETDRERGIWVMFPRVTRPHYRYKKYSIVSPVQITRPLARSVVFADGETLEERLLDAGARSWPVSGEVSYYELLPGAQLGHVAAFELEGETVPYGEAAEEFEELAPSRPLPLRHPGARGGGRRPGTRLFRVRVPGLRLRRRPRLALRLDLTAAKPELRVHLRVGERSAHLLVGHLEQQRLAQVVAAVRQLVGPPVQQALAVRLQRMLTKRGITLAEGGSARLSAALTEAIVRAVAQQLPAAAATLTTAAKDPAPGVTLTFVFPFADREAIAKGEPGDPTLTIRSGTHRD